MNKKDNKKIWGHIETINREMGEVKTDVTWLKDSINDVEKRLEGVDKRVWAILILIFGSVLLQILFKLYGG